MNVFDKVGKPNNGHILSDAGLDWQVELSDSIVARCPSITGQTTDLRATVRTDTGSVLGIVSENYQIVQNESLVSICEHTTKNNNLNVSTAGELYDGKRVWVAVKANSFNVGTGDDEVMPYLLVTNGHDGKHSLGATPTSIRVVCQNTLNMAIQEGRQLGSFISIRHKGDMGDKIESMMDTLGRFYKRTAEFAEQANYLARNNLDSLTLAKYFSDSYDMLFKSAETDRSKNKRINTIIKWHHQFNEEAHFGANFWTAMNAITHYLDHNSSFRGDNKEENKFSSNILGKNADMKLKLLTSTLNWS